MNLPRRDLLIQNRDQFLAITDILKNIIIEKIYSAHEISVWFWLTRDLTGKLLLGEKHGMRNCPTKWRFCVHAKARLQRERSFVCNWINLFAVVPASQCETPPNTLSCLEKPAVILHSSNSCLRCYSTKLNFFCMLSNIHLIWARKDLRMFVKQ